ncbi:MAG: hypothetical protein JWP12_2086 [Bacteroidetes bacterium]|nr:hypothetical protein [Bacteroidota bacterium]
MKKPLLSLLSATFLLATAVSVAQPTLTATGMNPVIGNTFTLNTSSTYFAPGSAGANQTWNFATNTGPAGTAAPYVTVSSTPNGSSFPNANVAVNNGGGIYSYQKTSSTAFQNYGNVSSGGVIMSFSNPEDFLRFPFTYNNTYSDPWAVNFVNGGYTFYRTGHTVVTADAYGTLITPAGTFTNVTRIHFHQIYQDSAYVGIPYVITYDNDEYLWYKDGTHSSLAATFTFTNSLSATPSQSSFYLSAGIAGVNDIDQSLSAYNVYPNPAVNNITLGFTLTENKTVETTIYNAIGQQVQTGSTVDAIQGENTLTLDVSTLPEGIYFAQIMVEGNLAGTKRFVVTR